MAICHRGDRPSRRTQAAGEIVLDFSGRDLHHSSFESIPQKTPRELHFKNTLGRLRDRQRCQHVCWQSIRRSSDPLFRPARCNHPGAWIPARQAALDQPGDSIARDTAQERGNCGQFSHEHSARLASRLSIASAKSKKARSHSPSSATEPSACTAPIRKIGLIFAA